MPAGGPVDPTEPVPTNPERRGAPIDDPTGGYGGDDALPGAYDPTVAVPPVAGDDIGGPYDGEGDGTEGDEGDDRTQVAVGPARRTRRHHPRCDHRPARERWQRQQQEGLVDHEFELQHVDVELEHVHEHHQHHGHHGSGRTVGHVLLEQPGEHRLVPEQHRQCAGELHVGDGERDRRVDHDRRRCHAELRPERLGRAARSTAPATPTATR